MLLIAGCGGGSDERAELVVHAVDGQPVGHVRTNRQPPDRLDIDVTIKGGEVNPTNAQLEAKTKEPIVIRVNSDVADELHVHSTPDHTFKIEPGKAQQFQFTVDVPGKVEIELHQLHKTIAIVQVQP